MKTMHVELVDTNREFDALRASWKNLHSDCRGATLANTWEWVKSWWDVYRLPHWRLTILVFRVGDELAGIAPLYRKRRAFHRELCFLGTGEREKDEVASEYPDFLVGRNFEDQFRRQAWQLLESIEDWDVVRVPNVLPDSIVADLTSPNQLRVSAGYRYRLPLPPLWADFLSARSSNMRRKIKNARKDMSTACANQKYCRNGSEDSRRLLVQLKQLHQIRWQSKGEPGSFASPKFCQFHDRIMAEFHSELGCELRVVSVNGTPIAALYNFRVGETDFFYQSGIIEHAHIRSPGILIHSLAIEHAIADGQRFYDLMRGGKDSYKNRFHCEVTELFNIVHFRRNFVAQSVHFLAVAKLRLKSLIM